VKVAVFASGEFGVPLVEYLLKRGELAILFTKTDKKKGRGMKMLPTPVASVVEAYGVPVKKADKLNRDLLSQYKEFDIDVSAVIDYGIYIPSYFYAGVDVPPMVNIHPSLLPRWRGPAPIQWTIYAGDMVSGITFHKLSKEIDAGDILYQKETPLTGREKATQLEEKLAHEVISLWQEFIPLFMEGKIQPKPQEGEPLYAPMFEKEKFHINFSSPCEEIDRLVRALADVPGAYAVFRGKRVKILYGECVSGDYDGEPSQIVFTGKERFGIKTGKGVYVPAELKPEGKKTIDSGAFIRGYRPEVGERWS